MSKENLKAIVEGYVDWVRRAINMEKDLDRYGISFEEYDNPLARGVESILGNIKVADESDVLTYILDECYGHKGSKQIAEEVAEMVTLYHMICLTR